MRVRACFRKGPTGKAMVLIDSVMIRDVHKSNLPNGLFQGFKLKPAARFRNGLRTTNKEL